MTDEGVIFHGYSDETGYAVDLKVRIEGELMRAWVRDPTDGDQMPWNHETTFETYQDLVSWVYEF